MMGGRTPETCWAVNKRQDNKPENCSIWLVIYLNCTMMHGLTNLKFIFVTNRKWSQVLYLTKSPDYWEVSALHSMIHSSPTSISSFLEVNGTHYCHKFHLTIERLSSDALSDEYHEHHERAWTDTRSHVSDVFNWKHKYYHRTCIPCTRCRK